jgi:phospholipid transport system substrate-binding protein
MTSLISRRRLLFSLISASAFPLSGAYAAVDAAAAKYVSSIGDDVIRLANGPTRGKALRSKFTSLLSRYVNLQSIAMSSLGTYRGKLPARDKAKFSQLVTTYAAALFVWYADDFKGQKFVVDGTTSQGKTILVETKITSSNSSNEQIVWRLAGSGGGFKVIDLKIRGVWLSIAMRDAFSRELKKSKGNFEQLYAFLREAETW